MVPKWPEVHVSTCAHLDIIYHIASSYSVKLDKSVSYTLTNIYHNDSPLCFWKNSLGQFHKRFNASIFILEWKHPKNCLGFLNTIFLAANIEQHVAHFSIFVVHFVVLVNHFGVFEAKFVFWRLGFMKSTPSGRAQTQFCNMKGQQNCFILGRIHLLLLKKNFLIFIFSLFFALSPCAELQSAK